LNGEVHPSYPCERCGCDSTSRQFDHENGVEFRICTQCNWVLGEPLGIVDEFIKEMWAMSKESGSPRPEDILAFIENHNTPSQTYEIQPLSEMEVQAHYESAMRTLDALYQINDQPAPSAEPGSAADITEQQMLGIPEELYDPGPDMYPG